MLKCKDQIINGQEKGLASFVSSFAIIRKLKTIRSTTKSWMSLLIWMNNGKFVLPGKLESLLCAGGMEFYGLIFRNIKQVDTFGRCHQIVKKLRNWGSLSPSPYLLWKTLGGPMSWVLENRRCCSLCDSPNQNRYQCQYTVFKVIC